ncbi:class I adenylate-forming enzyme family protein [uncultured Roseobacter sp.]|uniref:class I adenylate-forming enzyme family protein n=1 Tax=uncultured Roseobacter sp. TaxID=114847 RepID=UPI002611E030|nr:class I adenylate-forming enzyme family protein [uncultured Roseobacter sp.]
MLSVVHEASAPDIPSPFNLAAYVLAQAAGLSEKTALEIHGPDRVETWSYGRLSAAVRGTATGLGHLGLVPGDRVLMRLGNTVDFPIAYLGALAAGLVPVPTSSALTAGEVARIIEIIRPAAVLRDPDVACPKETPVIMPDELHRWRELPPAEWHMGDPERPGYIIFTSGTSGVPRAVLHAHRAILGRAMMFRGWYGLCPGDRLMHAGAFNWTYTLGTGLMDPWTCGATAVIPAAGTGSEALPGVLRRSGATIFAAAPGVYRQMLRAAGPWDLPELRHGLSAGEKLPQSVAETWRAVTGTAVYEAYGMSECSTFVSGCPATPARTGTLGRAQPGRHIALIGQDGPVPRGSEGTIAVHRDDPGLMLGYLDAPRATADRMQGEWFLTGDQAVMDDDGQITYLGRNDDMMNAGGFRVSPVEVENTLAHVPGITAVAVTDVALRPDTRVIAAFYTGPAPLDDAMLRDYVGEKLARYKQPRLFIHMPALPLGANGKILRRALRDQFKAPA